MDSFRWVSLLMSRLLGRGLAPLLNGVVTVLRPARPRGLDWPSTGRCCPASPSPTCR